MHSSSPAFVKLKRVSQSYCQTSLSNEITSNLLDAGNDDSGVKTILAVAQKMRIPGIKNLCFDDLKSAVVHKYLTQVFEVRDQQNPLSLEARSGLQYNLQDVNWFILVQFRKAYAGIISMINRVESAEING